jgi:uncharacterized RDD family membrane protein YckC
MADDNWYYAQNNQQLGPVTLAALRSMVANGQVGAGDLVWTQGMAQWLPARSVPEIGSILLGGGGGGGMGNYPASSSGYAPVTPGAGAPGGGQLGYGVGQTYYQQQYTGGYNLEYAGFWLRFAAAFIDNIIIQAPFWILQVVIEVTNPPVMGPNGVSTPTGANIGLNCASGLANILVFWLYYALQESGEHQATLGKRAVGIKVVSLEGQRLSFANATGRTFGKILSQLICLIGYIMAAFTERKQALHDMMAGTLVVRK